MGAGCSGVQLPTFGGPCPRRPASAVVAARSGARPSCFCCVNRPFLSLYRYRESTRGFGWYDWLGWFFPCFVWLRSYDVRGWLLVSLRFFPWLPFSWWLGGCSVVGQLLAASPAAVQRSRRRQHCRHVLPHNATCAAPAPLQSDVAAGLSVGAMVIPQVRMLLYAQTSRAIRLGVVPAAVRTACGQAVAVAAAAWHRAVFSVLLQPLPLRLIALSLSCHRFAAHCVLL